MMITAAMLKLIQQSGEGILVLVDGLEEQEFCHSRLTRQEVRRLLATMADTLQALPEATQQAMPELDWPGWRTVMLALASPPPSGDEAAWFAARALVPATLSWLRVYERAEPALFAFRP